VDLYTITVEGTKLRQVTDLPGKELAPDWSPSGPRLVYRGATRFSERIFTIRADGTGKKLIASDGQGPVFSPDGKRIAFTRNRDLYKVTSGGSGEPARSMVRRSRGSWRPIGDRCPLLLGGSPWCKSEEIWVEGVLSEGRWMRHSQRQSILTAVTERGWGSTLFFPLKKGGVVTDSEEAHSVVSRHGGARRRRCGVRSQQLPGTLSRPQRGPPG
jgi:hypothetical protein